VIKVVPIGLSCCRIPFAGKYTLRSFGIVESNMESANTGEKINELVGGLPGHASPKQNLGRFKSHKWTPVHPGITQLAVNRTHKHQ
jgi:hypothetical protein